MTYSTDEHGNPILETGKRTVTAEAGRKQPFTPHEQARQFISKRRAAGKDPYAFSFTDLATQIKQVGAQTGRDFTKEPISRSEMQAAQQNERERRRRIREKAQAQASRREPPRPAAGSGPAIRGERRG